MFPKLAQEPGPPGQAVGARANGGSLSGYAKRSVPSAQGMRLRRDVLSMVTGTDGVVLRDEGVGTN